MKRKKRKREEIWMKRRKKRRDEKGSRTREGSEKRVN
jgi:hypothetical protein